VDDYPANKEGHMARKHRMYGLDGIKEDAVELLAVGGGAVVGIAAAKAVTGFIEGMAWTRDGLPEGAEPTKEQIAAAKFKTWAPYASAAVPLVVGAGVIFAANKANLQGNARKAAVGVAAGMAAVAIGKIVVAAAPDLAKKVYLNGLGADNYDTGLLAGLGEIDATVAAYMNRGLMGYPTQIQELRSSSSFAGAPILVQNASEGMIGSPTVAQQLSGAPLSATLM
jgi:hypothetical protein